MNRQPVSSSNIKSIGWENNTLEVEFLQGIIYQYKGVSKEVYESMLVSSSKGKFLHTNIKPNFPGIKKE